MFEAIVGGLIGAATVGCYLLINPKPQTNNDLKIKQCENKIEELKKEVTNLILDFHDLSTRLTRKK